MINNYFVDDDKVYTYDTGDDRVLQLEYQDNIDEIFKLKNKREILEENIASVKDTLKTLTKNEKSKWGILAIILIIVLVLIPLFMTPEFKIFPFIPKIILLSILFVVFGVGVYNTYSDCLSHKKFKKQVNEIELQIDYLEKELVKVKEAEKQAKNKKSSKTSKQNYSRVLTSYNEEQRELLSEKLILISEYLNNKEKYQAKLQNGEFANNPEEESFVRELIKKDQNKKY